MLFAAPVVAVHPAQNIAALIVAGLIPHASIVGSMKYFSHRLRR